MPHPQPTIPSTVSNAFGINDVADSTNANAAAGPVTGSVPRLVRSSEAVVVEIPGEKASLFLDSSSTNNQLIIGTMEVEPDAGPPPHVHANEDEIFIIQSGEIEFFINGEYILATAGDVVYAARGEAHCFRGHCAFERNVMTGLIAPGGFERFFIGRAELMASADTTPAQLIEQARSFGITIFPPGAQIPIARNARSRIVRAGTAPWLEAFGDRIGIVLSSAQTEGKYTLVALETPPDGGPPLHLHQNEDELFMVCEGTFEFTLETEVNGTRAINKVLAYPGDIVWGPRLQPHTFRNAGETTGRMWVAMLPGNFDLFFADCAYAFEDGSATPEKMVAIGIKYGVQYLV